MNQTYKKLFLVFHQIRYKNTFLPIYFPQRKYCHRSVDVTSGKCFPVFCVTSGHLMGDVRQAFLICGLILVRSEILTGLPLSILFLAAIPVRIARAPSRKPAACR
jgi:hypothetical protein